MNPNYLKKNKNATFESARLFYRGIMLEDASKIVEWRSNRQIFQYCRNHSALTMEGHLAWFKKYLTDTTRFDYMILEKATGQKIGTVGLQNLCGTAGEISYLIDVQSQGMGFGSEAIRAMSAYAFDHFKLKRLSAEILVGNSASVRAAQHAGYKFYSQIYVLNKQEIDQ